MRKSILSLTIFLALGMASLQAQWKVGINAGIPVGAVEGFFDFNAGADVAYLFEVGKVLEVGPMVGYSHYFGDRGVEGPVSWKVHDVQFLPLAASGRVSLGGTVFVGADLGYGFDIKERINGGFYYRPKLGFGLFGLSVIGSYSGIGSFSTVNVGLEYSL